MIEAVLNGDEDGDWEVQTDAFYTEHKVLELVSGPGSNSGPAILKKSPDPICRLFVCSRDAA